MSIFEITYIDTLQDEELKERVHASIARDALEKFENKYRWNILYGDIEITRIQKIITHGK